MVLVGWCAGKTQMAQQWNSSFDEYGRSTGSRLIASNGKQQAATQTLYDVLDRPVSITTAGGAKETFEYAVDGDLAVVTRKQSITGNGNVQNVESKEYRNALGQVVKTVSPDGGVTEMNYDGFGNLKSSRLTPAGGGEVQVRSFVYDSLGRLSKVRSADQKEGFDYKYAGLDLVAATTFNPDGAVSRTYEYKGPGGQLSLEALIQKDSRAVMEYGYDAYGALTGMTYPSGRKIGYVHDSLGRVKGVNLDGKPVVSQVQFNEWGNRREMQFASGAFDRWEFDELGLRLKTWAVGHGGQAFEDGVRQYTYDSAERLTGAGEWSLLHNVMGQLTQANFNPLNQKNAAISTFHTYDGYGNQAFHLAMGAGATAMINYDLNPMADNKVAGLAKNNAATGWKYNADGEATSIGVAVGSSQSLNLVWDSLGRLSSVAGPGTHQHYTYDANGMRVALKDSVAPGNNRRYFYGAGGLLIGEYGISKRNAGTREVIYLGSEPIAEVDEKGIHDHPTKAKRREDRTESAEPIAAQRARSVATSQLHKDHLGTPRLITSGITGKIEGRQAYGAYGEFLPDASPDNTYKPLIGYTGHIQTDATGLIYMRGRYYSPAWHRFVNSDQGVDPNSPNQFAYCIGSPMMAVDPSGMSWIGDFWDWWTGVGNEDFGYWEDLPSTTTYGYNSANVPVACKWVFNTSNDWGDDWEDDWDDNTGNASHATSYSSGGSGASQQTNSYKEKTYMVKLAAEAKKAGLDKDIGMLILNGISTLCDPTGLSGMALGAYQMQDFSMTTNPLGSTTGAAQLGLGVGKFTNDVTQGYGVVAGYTMCRGMRVPFGKAGSFMRGVPVLNKALGAISLTCDVINCGVKVVDVVYACNRN